MTTGNSSQAVMAGEFKAIRPPGGFRVILTDPPWLSCEWIKFNPETGRTVQPLLGP